MAVQKKKGKEKKWNKESKHEILTLWSLTPLFNFAYFGIYLQQRDIIFYI